MKPSRRRLIQQAGLIALVLVAYSPAWLAGFIWDDDRFLTANPVVLAADGLRRIWLTRQAADYWPVTYSAGWFEWRLWGSHPLGYHLVNVALHLGCVLLLWRILDRLAIRGAWLAAALFAVHPLNAETVIWITQLKGLLAMLFFLVAIACDLAESALGVVAFVLALLCKGDVVPLPAVLLGLAVWRGRPVRTEARRLLPYFIVAAAFAAVNVWTENHSYLRFSDTGPLARVLGAGAVIGFYLGKAVWPADLSFIYGQWKIAPGRVEWWLPDLAVLSVTVLLAWGAWRGPKTLFRPLLAGWGYFVVMLAPVLGLADVAFMAYSRVADHYVHLALIGLTTLAGAAWAAWGRIAPAAARVTALGVLLVLTAMCWRQGWIYGDAATLYRVTIARNPDAWLARIDLGCLLATAGEPEQGIRQFEGAAKALERDRGNLPLAEASLRYDRSLLDYNWAKSLRDAGQNEAAIERFDEAIELEPRLAAIRTSLAISLARAGRLPEAIAQTEAALRLDPADLEARRNLDVLRQTAAQRGYPPPPAGAASN